MSDSYQFWSKPKKAKASKGEAWWYALEPGSIAIYTYPQQVCVTITAAKLREFINMLDHHKPRRRGK